MTAFRNTDLAFKKIIIASLIIIQSSIKMEESFHKDISGYNCKFFLNKQTLHITCLSPNHTYQLFGLFSENNIPENIKGNLASSTWEIYGLIQVSKYISIVEGQLTVGYQIGKKIKFFRLPLLKRDIDRKDILIAKLSKENKLKQQKVVKKQEIKELRQQLAKKEHQIQHYRKRLQRKEKELQLEKKQKQELVALLKQSLKKTQPKQQPIKSERKWSLKKQQSPMKTEPKEQPIKSERKYSFLKLTLPMEIEPKQQTILSQQICSLEEQTSQQLTKFNQQPKESELIKQVERLAEEVITGKTKDIDLSSKGLKHIDDLRGITTINILDLRCNQLLNLDGLRGIITLERLDLSKNKLQNVDGLKGITTINQLHLNHNQLQNVDGLREITTINTLHLHNNPALRISFVPSSLQRLIVYVPQISDFDFKSLSQLKYIYSDCTNRKHFRNLPQSVCIHIMPWWME